MKRGVLLVAIHTLLLVGCGTFYDPIDVVDVKYADFGPYPVGYKRLVKEHFQGILIDPDSMKLQFLATPYEGYCVRPSSIPKNKRFGYGVPVRVNAKNSYGGYTGSKDYVLFIRNDEVVKYEAISELDPEGNYDGYNSPVKMMNKLRPKPLK